MTLRRQDSQDKPSDWEPKPGDRVVRHPRQEEIGPVVVTEPVRRVPARVLASPMLIIYAFLGLIAVGTLLLMLPFTQHSGEFTPFREALFTATSAVTVTGLVIQDTASYWTRTGQTIILGLIFVGGLGFMTIGTFLLILIGQRVTLTQRLLVRESLGVNQLGGLVQLTIAIVLVAVAIQTIGFFVLLAKFLGIYPTAEAVWQAAFHAVSGFNNAGFLALTEEDGLGRFQADWVVLGTIGTLIVLGAISYWVIFDVVKYRRFSLFTLTTKLVLVFTGGLILLGTVGFFAFEYGNPDTIGPMPLEDKLMTSAFESISGRTAGFTTVGFGNTEQQTNFFFTSLMFIGGASGSVAGGIKVNTFAIVIIAVLSTIRGRRHTSVFGREIPQTLLLRVQVIGAVSIAFVFLIALLLTFAEGGGDFIALLFESVSAFGTVGLSTGVTPDLSYWGHLILIVAMFVGRLGPLTVGLAMARRSERDLYRFAQEQVTIG